MIRIISLAFALAWSTAALAQTSYRYSFEMNEGNVRHTGTGRITYTDTLGSNEGVFGDVLRYNVNVSRRSDGGLLYALNSPGLRATLQVNDSRYYHQAHMKWRADQFVAPSSMRGHQRISFRGSGSAGRQYIEELYLNGALDTSCTSFIDNQDHLLHLRCTSHNTNMRITRLP